ncbi:MAG: proteasome subunit alpha, partial [Candidatus Thermoplasmatota archaeon]|nr:proteasome subunit alpha [Candidatus Thermoplasmatota archaeon]
LVLEEKITTEMLVKRICDYKQNYTQYGGVRPFGTALLVGGVDNQGIHLFETDPSGALSSYKAGCIGSGRAQVIDLFENKFKDGMSMDDAILLGLEGLKISGDEAPTDTTVEIGLIRKGEKFVRLEPEQIKKYTDKL